MSDRRRTWTPEREGLCEHQPVMVPGIGRGGFPAMVATESYCPDRATRIVTFRNGDVEHLCGRHAGIEKRRVYGPGITSVELIAPA